jgi:uncharacterized protein YndB with AHSA1/START domain
MYMKTVKSEITLKAPLAQAYRAFTNSTAFREWLCDFATVDPRPRGRLYLWWNGDFYSSGHYLALEQDRQVKFQWFANIDPAATEVTVTFDQANGDTVVVLAHEVPDTLEWEHKASEFLSNWDASLRNLKSVLESGIDLRIANRPMIGIFPGDFTPAQAEQLKVPVKEGLRLDGVMEGMGAAKAGLQKDDVIVAVDGRSISSDFIVFQNALAGKKGGDQVEIEFYRGPQKKTVTMELTRRTMVAVPFDAGELAFQGRSKIEAALAEVDRCFRGVTDAQAAARPGPGEWSALDVLAHLLQGERFFQFFIVELEAGFLRQADDFGGYSDAHICATVTVYPTIVRMLEAVHQGFEETLNLVGNLPASFVQNKASFYRVGSFVLQNDSHIYTHISQIKAALTAASHF